jgi:uncharacterized protein
MTGADLFPIPHSDSELIKPFWNAAAQGRLEMPQCVDCGAFNWYPGVECRHCRGEKFNWVRLPDTARIFSWTVVKRALHAPYKVMAPYVPVLVEFDEAPGVRLVTRLVDMDAGMLAINGAVAITFKDLGYPATTTGVVAPLATNPKG